MSLAAIYWAKVGLGVYGVHILDAAPAGSAQMPIRATTLADIGRSGVKVEGVLLRDGYSVVFDE
jgi:hypothetical protein